MKARTRLAIGATVIFLALLGLLAVACYPAVQSTPQPQVGDDPGIDQEDTRSYNAACYRQQQTGNFVCAAVDDLTVGGLYPMVAVGSGKKSAAGMTSGVIQSATVVPTAYAISTVTAYGCGPKTPAYSGAWECRASLGASNQITITLIENDATPVPTAAYQQAVWWVQGN